MNGKKPMPDKVDAGLQQLIALWIDGTRASLLLIPPVCDRIAELAANGTFTAEFDPSLAWRASLLAVKAEQRLTACLAIQSRTGSYSTQGELERSPHVATAGWEG
jgi:hypothetical protein